MFEPPTQPEDYIPPPFFDEGLEVFFGCLEMRAVRIKATRIVGVFWIEKTKLGIENQFLPSSHQERSGSGESDFLNYWGKGKREREKETGRVGDGDLERD
ncbi:hypothetical protein NC651_026524 [Populus alba x Populus x berolinensis]|nr:hypothetical protein NC651_026524 [Populus alba x Populus x berolinensis]